MWLPKDERKVLRYLYVKIPRENVGNTVRLQLTEFAQCCFDEDSAVATARLLAERGLLKLEMINHPSNFIEIGFTLNGYDLSRRYSSKYDTVRLWCDEYKIWIILGVAISAVALVVTVLKK